MKQDNLEKFIIENRDDFDVFEPGEGLWEKIQEQAKPVRKLSWNKVAWRVAAGLAIFIASYFFHDIMQPGADKQVAVVEDESSAPGDEKMQMLMEAEVFYTAKISAAREEIYILSGQDKQMIDILDMDLNELDTIFTELKNDLKDDNDNEEVIEAMIQNYRIKMEILEEMLFQLNKSKVNDNKDDGYEI
ncbi:MAG: hypothetical protein K9G76_07495 [Bacteroidales bacterium]|nr:hypothetical protein [Bacteroidales bacterium]MCF8406221.1 hypothetical protein [Bacteroidales bacterium]